MEIDDSDLPLEAKIAFLKLLQTTPRRADYLKPKLKATISRSLRTLAEKGYVKLKGKRKPSGLVFRIRKSIALLKVIGELTEEKANQYLEAELFKTSYETESS